MIQFLFELVLNKCIECQSLVMKIAFKYFRGFFFVVFVSASSRNNFPLTNKSSDTEKTIHITEIK